MLNFRNGPCNYYNIPLVDNWMDTGEYFTEIKDYIYVNYIRQTLNLPDNDPLPYFNMSKKKSYNNPDLRKNLVHYLNYFLTFFDSNKELLVLYRTIKIKIDTFEVYSVEELFNDLSASILSPTMLYKVSLMNDYNCSILDIKKNSHIRDNLRYDKNHLSILYNISILMRIAIPILSHYIYRNPDIILQISNFLLDFYNIIFRVFDINIERKLISTAENRVDKSTHQNYTMWEKLAIQGFNDLTHALVNLSDVIICVLPKIRYNANAYQLIDVAIKKNIDNHVINRRYDFEYLKLVNNVKNEIEFDKFEISMSNSSESVLIYSQANSDITTQKLFAKYPIDDKLVAHYHKELSDMGASVMHPFQEKIIFNLFYKDYGDVISIKNTNSENYVRLMLIAKEKLKSQNLYLLAEMVSSKIVSTSSRKDLNKKEKSLLESSELYKEVMRKYNNDEKIVSDIRSMIATSITTEFKIIDPNNELYGMIIPIHPTVVIYQILSFITLI